VENQSNSRTKKSQKNLKISLNGDFQLTKNTSTPVLKYEVLSQNSSVLPDVVIENTENSVNILSRLISNQSLSLNPRNCYAFLNLLSLKKDYSSISSVKPVSSSSNNKSNMDALKKLEQALMKLQKKGNSTSLKNLVTTLKDDFKLFDLHSDSLSIQTFLSSLFDLSFFINFTTIQLFVHEKGKNEAETHTVFKSGKYFKKNTSVVVFAQAFQSIKKSKTKIFNNFQNQQVPFEVLGPFLAKEFELNDYSAVIIISRDGFLPVTTEDNQYLNEISSALKSIFLSLVVKTKFSDRQKTLLCSLNFFPEPLLVKVAGNIIFKNKSYINNFIEKLHTPSIYKLGQDKELLLWQIESDDTISDLGHFQRVSLLGELLNTLRHELSNPLFGLSLSSQLLLATSKHPENAEFLKAISDSTDRCNEIIMNFSDLYLDANNSKIISLEKIINEVFTLSKSETRGICKTIHFCEPLTSSLQINTNPTLVSQILFNLVINSAQAIAGKVTRPTIQVHISEESGQLTISVSDNGPELDKSQIDNLFKPFYTTKKAGNGLGLSICKNLAKRLGGDLCFKTNKPFPGLTFSLVLPY
jgi:two-component system, NtrC family, sensor kinase